MIDVDALEYKIDEILDDVFLKVKKGVKDSEVWGLYEELLEKNKKVENGLKDLVGDRLLSNRSSNSSFIKILEKEVTNCKEKILLELVELEDYLEGDSDNHIEALIKANEIVKMVLISREKELIIKSLILYSKLGKEFSCIKNKQITKTKKVFLGVIKIKEKISIEVNYTKDEFKELESKDKLILESLYKQKRVTSKEYKEINDAIDTLYGKCINSVRV